MKRSGWQPKERKILPSDGVSGEGRAWREPRVGGVAGREGESQGVEEVMVVGITQ